MHQLQSIKANGGARGRIAVRFFEKRRRKSTWFATGGDEEICWEAWLLEVTIATPQTESGWSMALVWNTIADPEQNA